MKFQKTAICIPIHGSLNALLFEQFLSFSAWCQEQKIPILTVANRTHNDARNWLATAGGGFSNPTQLIDAFDTLVWIDADQVFSPKDVVELLRCDAPFCTGWYLNGTTPMVARWDEAAFLSTGHMDFVSQEELKQSKEALLEVSYCGFGFTKTSTELFKGLRYPYFTNKLVRIGNYTENVSEDASFCLDVAHHLQIQPKVLTGLKVGHLKPQVI